MAKGGGRGKGRPRKLPVVVAQPQFELNPAGFDSAECSTAAKSRSTELVEITTDESPLQQIDLEIETSMVKQSADLTTEAEKEATARKIAEEVVPIVRKKGMALGYVAPHIKQGILPAKLVISEIEREAEKWRNVVIFYVIGSSPTITYLTKFLQNQCEITGKFEIYYHNEGYFVIKFELTTDKEKMLYEGPHMIGSRPTIVKEWTAEFCFEKEALKEIPLWIRLPKLPLTCWSGDSLSRIGSVLGKPICADDCTTQQKRISYARLLVEVDITKPLVYKIQIEGDKGNMLEQQVYYEWAPMFCQKCHVVGHICKDRKPPNTAPIQKQQWKEKGKEVVVDTEKEHEVWNDPKRPTSTSIQVGHIEVPTRNGFHRLQDFIQEGGDLFPSVEI